MEKDEAIKLLKSEDKSDIRFAIEELASFAHEDVVVAIVDRVLEKKIKSITFAAKEVLKEFVDIKDVVIRESIRMIYGDNPKIRAVAVEILSTFGDDSLDQIDKLLSDEDYNHRKYGVDALACIITQSSLDTLGKMLDDPNPNVRYTAVESLQGFKGFSESLEGYMKIAIESLDPSDMYGVAAIYETMKKTDLKDKKLLEPLKNKLEAASAQFVKHYLYKMLIFQGEHDYIESAKQNADQLRLMEDLQKDLDCYVYKKACDVS